MNVFQMLVASSLFWVMYLLVPWASIWGAYSYQLTVLLTLIGIPLLWLVLIELAEWIDDYFR